MDTRYTTIHGLSATSVWRHAAALLVAVVLVAMLAVPASAAASECLVTNVDTGQTFTALQPAVDAASTGVRLTVQGTCEGGVVIVKNLVIEGMRTQTAGRPTLSGAGKTRVVNIKTDVRVKLRSLVIRDGKARYGAGARNMGTLNLRDVTVRGNRARFGGGVSNEGTLLLNGASSIRGNWARMTGGGVANDGTVVMNSSSSISGNTTYWGGGVVQGGGSFTMNGSSSIFGNTAARGGGVFGGGSYTMNGSSSIHGNRARLGGGFYANFTVLTLSGTSSIYDNSARRSGGGVYGHEATLVGANCGPGGNVYGNTPDDCFFE